MTSFILLSQESTIYPSLILVTIIFFPTYNQLTPKTFYTSIPPIKKESDCKENEMINTKHKKNRGK